MGTIICLNEYFFRERMQWYFREGCSENLYIIENRDCEPGAWMIIHEVLIAHESSYSVEMRG